MPELKLNHKIIIDSYCGNQHRNVYNVIGWQNENTFANDSVQFIN